MVVKRRMRISLETLNSNDDHITLTCEELTLTQHFICNFSNQFTYAVEFRFLNIVFTKDNAKDSINWFSIY